MKQGCYLAFVYIGLVIGAGFASGREIMEYFNLPSLTDHRGVVLASFLLIVTCYLILRRASQNRLSTCEEYLTAVCGRFAPWVNRLILLYLFCGFFTMLSGCGALLNQTFLLPTVLGNLLLALFCFVVLIFDLKGIVTVNLVLVPLMIVGICTVCTQALLFHAVPTFSARELTHGVCLSAVCYVGYNTLSAPSVLVPLQKGTDAKGILFASLLGGFILGLMILLIWLSQSVFFEALRESSLPLLKLAAMSGRTEKYLYTAVLFMAITTTAVSQGFGFLSHFRLQSFADRCKGAAIFCLAALPFSLFGFSSLVSNLYSLFGILGILLMAVMFIDFYRKR